MTIFVFFVKCKYDSTVIFNCYHSAKYRLVAVEYFRMKVVSRPPNEIVHRTSHLAASSRMCLISPCDASL